MNLHRDTYSNSRSHGIWIQGLATPRHISDRLAEAISPRTAGFLEHDRAARSVFRYRATALSRGSRRRGLRNLRPREWCRDCQSYAEYYCFHCIIYSFLVLLDRANAHSNQLSLMPESAPRLCIPCNRRPSVIRLQKKPQTGRTHFLPRIFVHELRGRAIHQNYGSVEKIAPCGKSPKNCQFDLDFLNGSR